MRQAVLHDSVQNIRPAPDAVLVDIAEYVCDYEISSAEAFDTARLCLMDTLGCGLEALSYPACTKLLGPIVRGQQRSSGQPATYGALQRNTGTARQIWL